MELNGTKEKTLLKSNHISFIYKITITPPQWALQSVQWTTSSVLRPSIRVRKKLACWWGEKKTIIGNGLHWSYMSVWQTHHRHCLLCLAVFFLLFCIFCFRCLSWTWRTVLVYIWWCLFCQCAFFCPCISPDSLTESWRSGLQKEIPSVSCMMDALNPRLLPPLGCSGSSDEPPIQVHQNTHTDSPNTIFFTDPELKHTCMTHNASKSVDRAPAALATAVISFAPVITPKSFWIYVPDGLEDTVK